MKTILWKPIAIVVMVATALFGMAILPGMAQDEVVSEGDLTIVTGAVQFISTGDIVVAGVVIAPASAFIPADLEEGDLVIISGVMLEDGTLRALSFEYFDDESEPEVTPEATPEATAEATPEATPVVDCGGNVHPVATSIAATFDVTYEEVMALHCAGNGFGNIVRAYALAEASEDGVTAADLLARHQSGEGWGQIMRESDVHP
ncbi:MAG: hypothetical protein JNJ78_09130, partial [Anaerolineae bacterium]|nr:hypothetical protein [Anaerolineae bacterium]